MTRRIDHLVLAVRDLDEAGETYERMGFQVGKRNRHPWGTENRLVQFGSSFLELISVGEGAKIEPHRPRHFSFGAFVSDYLAEREGLAMFVLDSSNARSDATRFAQTGIGDFEPFFFERKGRRPSGEEMRVAFSLAFAMHAALPGAAFFVCEQHAPENFWNPEFQDHANGAVDVVEVTCALPAPDTIAAFIATFADVPALDLAKDGFTVGLGNHGKFRVVNDPVGHGLTSFAVSVADLDCVDQILRNAGLEFRRPFADRITVGLEGTFGVMIEFVAHTAKD